MAELDLIRRVRARLDKPEHWTRGSFARDAKGNAVVATDPKATCWCLVGAFLVESPDPVNPINSHMATQRASKIVTIDRGSNSGSSVVTFNDGASHAEVIALLDRSIERLEMLE